MPTYLLFLFLFQGGLAFVFTYFIAILILKGSADGDSQKSLKVIRKLRNSISIGAILIPLAMFVAFYKSLPEDQPTNVAIWPALWIFVILASVVLALTVAIVRRPDQLKGE